MKMRNFKRKRLNNKGFTLIELLAVVVILAVVMGIAMTSVLSAMNNSRKGSLQDSATSVSRAFQTKYSEAMVTGTGKLVYSDLLTDANSYNFTTATADAPVVYELDEDLKDDMNISPSTYKLAPSAAKSNLATGTTATVTNSVIVYNGKSFAACMIATETGSYYVSNAGKAAGSTLEVLGVTLTFNNRTGETGNVMYSCSIDDGSSW